MTCVIGCFLDGEQLKMDLIFGKEDNNWIVDASKLGRGLNPIINENEEPELGVN